MSEMVERVGNRLMDIIIDIMENAVKVGDKCQDFQQRRDQLGRAAILAMREPTEGMYKAGAAVWDDDWCTETNALNMWQSGIDEALK